MSHARLVVPRSAVVQASLDRVWADIGRQVREGREARGWTTQVLAARAGVSRGIVYLLERGEPTSLEVAIRCLSALGLRLELEAVDPRRRRQASSRAEDPVHAAMGEIQAAHLRKLGYFVSIDEPYQHYQFAGRADVVAWATNPPSLLHIENRTQFPNYQEAAGSFNAKRAYLAPILAERAGVRRFESVTHVMACLWSAEVLHAIRLRPETFRSLAPDGPDAFERCWNGATQAARTTSTLVILDPLAHGRQRRWIGLDEALGAARPRHRGYADAAVAVTARRSQIHDLPAGARPPTISGT